MNLPNNIHYSRVRDQLFVKAVLSAGILVFTAGAFAQTITIKARSLPAVSRIDPRFQSYNVEMAEIIGGRFWAPYPQSNGAIEPQNTQKSGGLDMPSALFRQRKPLDRQHNRRLLNLAKAQWSSPSTVR